MKKLASLSIAAALIATGASAKVSFSLDIEALSKTAADGGGSISDKGLLVLVVDTSDLSTPDGFQLPEENSFVSGTNDEVVATWDLDDYDFNSSDVTLVTEGGVSYGDNWKEDQKLALFWFPNLSAGQLPSATETYGVFSDVSNLASGDRWEMPANGTLLHSLKLFTSSATKLVSAGDFPAAIGLAAYAVDSPPSASAEAPNLAVTNGAGKSTLTWTANGDPAGFVVQRKNSSGDWESIGLVSADQDPSFEDPDVQPGVDYEYRLLSVGSLAATVSNLPAAITSERLFLTNVSARSRVVAGNPATQMFGGVIVKGEQNSSKSIVLQAIGKSLLGNGFIEDPNIDLFESGVLTASNDDWLQSASALDLDVAMGIGNAIPLGDDGTSKDSSDLISATVGKGYSFAVSSKGGDTADLFMGIFDANYATPSDTGDSNRIANLAARGFLGDDAQSLFAGSFIVRGTPGIKKEVLVMAWGPHLSNNIDPSLVGLTVADPELNMWNGGSIVATNDNWESQPVASAPGYTFETDVERIKRVVSGLGYLPLDQGSPDAVFLMTVEPGAYSFSYTGKGGTGIGFLTIDEVENID